MSIGLDMNEVHLEPHQIAWEETAKKTIEKLKSILGDILIGCEHIGSTAIKNISAKPIIDIMIGVNSFEELFKKNDILKKNGFNYAFEYYPCQHLYICGHNNFITHHIHALIYDSEVWNNFINFRDYLNTHEDEAIAYEKFKMDLMVKYANDRNSYTREKKIGIIDDLIVRANAWKKHLKNSFI